MANGRAKKGGDTGMNGHDYKGGQFLPSTMNPPGTWTVKIKGKTKRVSGRTMLIEPGKLADSPTPYSQAIFSGIRSFVNIDNGVMSLNERLAFAIDNYGRADMENAVALYNSGERWVEVIPNDVEIISK